MLRLTLLFVRLAGFIASRHVCSGCGFGHFFPAVFMAAWSADSWLQPRLVFDGEAGFDGHLPMIHITFTDRAARFNRLEPEQILDAFVSAFKSLKNAVLDGSGRGDGEVDEFIGVGLARSLNGSRRRSRIRGLLFRPLRGFRRCASESGPPVRSAGLRCIANRHP